MILLTTTTNLPDEISKLDRTKNIILCTPPNNDILKINDDGIVSIVNPDKLSFCNNVAYENNSIRFDLALDLKLSIPNFIHTRFVDGIPIFNKVFKDINKLGVLKDGSQQSTYSIYDSISFTFYISFAQLKKYNSLLQLPSNTLLINIYFTYIFNHNVPLQEVEGIYWIKDKEIYENFKELI